MSDQGDGVPVVRIFLSSPGDVAKERDTALSVIKRVGLWFRGRLVLVPILWEHEPLLASAGFQQEIARRLPPSKADIAVFVLWSRLGTPLSKDFELEDGRRPTGTEWEFLDAMQGRANEGLPDILIYRKPEAPTLSLAPDKAEERRAAEKAFEVVEKFFTEQFQDKTDLTFQGSYHTYGDASEFGERFQEHLTKLLEDRLRGGAVDASRVTWRTSPFRGLEAFDVEHAEILFGRTRAIHEVARALRIQIEAKRAFVAVLGPSGNGKSSLVRAGVVPLLATPGAVEDEASGGFSRVAILQPGTGLTPLHALVDALFEARALPTLSKSGDIDTLAETLSEGPTAIAALVRGALHDEAASHQVQWELAAPPPGRLVLVVDQLEELWTREGVGPKERDIFVRVLDVLARSGLVYILATLRSDFYPLLAADATLCALKDGGGQIDLALPDPAEIEQIVRRPAQVAGLVYESNLQEGALDETLIVDASSKPDLLPLLQYTLHLLYESRDGSTLTRAAYDDLGGLEGALARRADQAWDGLSEPARSAFPSVLRALVEVPQQGDLRATRRRVPYAEITRAEGAKELADAFVKARLLIADGEADEAVISVAHETLFRVWDRAARQIEAEGRLLRIHSRLRTRAKRWVRRERRRDLLLQAGEELGEARLLLQAGFTLDEDERAFVGSSEAHARRVRLLKRAAFAALVLLTLGTGVLGWTALDKARQAQREAANAERSARASRASEKRTKAVALAIESGRPVPNALALRLARDAVRISPHPEALTALELALRLPQEVASLDGHEESLNSAVFSPDGMRVLTASRDETVRLWDLNGTQRVVLEDDDFWAIRATFSPDGKHILTGNSDHTVRLWDLQGNQLRIFRGHERTVRDVAFSADGESVLTGGDGYTRLWDLSGKPLYRFHARQAVISPDGTHIFLSSYNTDFKNGNIDSRSRIWNRATEKSHVFRGYVSLVNSARFSPDGKSVLTAAHDKMARLWSLEGKETQVFRGHGRSVESAEFSPNGERVLTASADDTARLWDLKGNQLRVFRDPGCRRAVFSPDGRTVLTFTFGSARIWDLNGRMLHVFRSQRRIDDASFSPDGRHVLTTPSHVGPFSATVWRLDGKRLQTLRGHEGAVESATFSPGGEHLLTAGKDGTARLWDTSGKELRVLDDYFILDVAVFSPDGKRVLTVGRDRMVIWNLDGTKFLDLGSAPWWMRIGGASFSPDGQQVLLALGQKAARFWNLMGKKPGGFLGYGSAVHSAVFSPDGKRVLTASGDRTARLWELGGKQLVSFVGHWESVRHATFSPDGMRVLTASDDKTARLWDLQGTELREFRGHEGRVVRAVFSPDGQRVLTASRDGTARLWDLEGLQLRVFRGHDGPLNSAEFSPDGRVVVTASDDGTAKRFFVDVEDLLAAAARRLGPHQRDYTDEEKVRYGELLEALDDE